MNLVRPQTSAPSPRAFRSSARPVVSALGLAFLFVFASTRPATAADSESTPPATAAETPAAGVSTNDPVSPPHDSGAGAATNATASASGATNATSRTEYPSFRLIADRNIFNTSRSPRSAGGSRSREVRRTPKVESVSLVGTLAYEKGRFAFFDGSSGEYRKVLRPGATIAGHTLESISQHGVRLAQGDQILELKVSQHLRREDDGPWKLSATAAPPSPSPSSSSSSASSTSGAESADASGEGSTSSSSGGGEASDILKRLMQQREKELK